MWKSVRGSDAASGLIASWPASGYKVVMPPRHLGLAHKRLYHVYWQVCGEVAERLKAAVC
jgi:hypothetical protein